MTRAPLARRVAAAQVLVVGALSVAAGPAGGAGELARAEAALDRGQVRVAEQGFRDVLVARPRSGRALVGLGRALAARGACDQALPILAEARFDAGWDERAWVAEGQCAWAVGRPHDALEAFGWAARRQPDAAVVWASLARVWQAVGEPAAAADAVERLLSCDGGVEQEALVRAELALRGGDDPDPWLAEAARTGGDSPLVAILEARRWMDLGDPVAADAALRGSPAPAAARDALLPWRAEALRRAGRTQEAHDLLVDRADAATDPFLRALWSRVLVDLGEIERARAALAAPADPIAPEWLASRWYAARDREPAEAARLAAIWRATNTARDRALDQLVPVAAPEPTTGAR